ncbi:MAG: histidine--tRNA ligase [Actinobacteria bacterium]|nr:histidine--tRNA ligase [Actinomycetota bacterium]
MAEFQTSPGTRDILHPDSARWRAFTARFSDAAEAAGFHQIIPPMFEDLGVFQRLGEVTDVVTKEMYDFMDKGGRHVALRPEHTASVCRAFVQHRPTLPWLVWYAGPNFRYEKAQHGRYRQFDQVGVEALGSNDPWLDAEVIALGWNFFAGLGLRDVKLVINSLGDDGDRERYVEILRSFLSANSGDLSKESLETLARNPLRVLDSKRDQDAAIVAGAPSIRESLSDAANEHFATVLKGLDTLGVPFKVNDRLVRGLDYYRRTTFEYVSTALDSAQNAIGGGGRYDGLVEDLGGPATPGIGFALGLDRTLLACDAEGVFAAPTDSTDLFVVDTTGGANATAIAAALRNVGHSVARAYDSRSMKSQMKQADKSGAKVTLIVGESEAETNTVIVRSMVDGTQRTIARDSLIEELKKEFK